MKKIILILSIFAVVNILADVCPVWNETTVYNQGDDVCYNSTAYELKPLHYNISGYDYRPDGPFAHFWQGTDDCDCEVPPVPPQTGYWKLDVNGKDIENTNSGDVKIKTNLQLESGTNYVRINPYHVYISNDAQNEYIDMNALTQNITICSGAYLSSMGPDGITTGSIYPNSQSGDLLISGGANIEGELWARKVKVNLDAFPDYIFSASHKLKSLSEIEEYIDKNGTLPDMPSENEVKEKGIDLGEMQVKLLEKIEEMTLHMISLEKKNNALEKEINEVKQQMENK